MVRETMDMAARSMLWLESLTIHRFRNVKPGTRLEFNPGMNVLLGKNATGKTTLLELISHCIRSDFMRFLEEEFELEYVLRSTEHRAIISVRNALQEGEASGTSSTAGLTLFVTFHLDGKPAPSLSSTGARPQICFYEGELFGRQDCYRFDEGLEAFSAILNRVSDSSRASIGSIPAASMTLLETSGHPFLRPPSGHQSLRGSVFSSQEGPNDGLGQFESFFMPSELRERLLADFSGDDERIDARLMERDLKFLKDAVQLLDFHKGQVRAEVLDAMQDRAKKTLGNLRFWLSHRCEPPVPVDRLSYGQKRLFAFIYYLHCNPEIVIADELTNGMHHDWIRDVVKRLEGRQSFLATQNPLLLDYLQFQSPEQVRSTFIQCQLKKGRGKKPEMIWAPLEVEDAERFYRSYESGGQYVSEILIVKGLW